MNNYIGDMNVPYMDHHANIGSTRSHSSDKNEFIVRKIAAKTASVNAPLNFPCRNFIKPARKEGRTGGGICLFQTRLRGEGLSWKESLFNL